MDSEQIKQKWGNTNTQLLAELKQSIEGYNWSPEYPLYDLGRQKADIGGLPKAQGYQVFVELERNRGTCVRNVTKVWMYKYKSESKDTQPILLIHIFSPAFNTKRLKWRREEAVFVGGKAQIDTNGNLVYKHIDLDHWPSDDPTLISWLAERIKDLLTEYQSKR